MSELEKKELLETIKKLPPDKQNFVVGVATGLAMREPDESHEPKNEKENP